MKTIINGLLLSVVIIAFSSCSMTSVPISSSTPKNNTGYEVDYLFEFDGLKFYRFRDVGNYVYFTKGTGEITSIKRDSTATRVTSIIRNVPSK